MSDTPRTDAKRVRFSSLCAEDDQFWVPYQVSSQLERELNAANARIKRLEDRIERASKAFFTETSDRRTASGMLAILEEERSKP